MKEIMQMAPAIGTLLLLAVTVIGNWRRGDSTASKEALDLREKQIAALKEQLTMIEQKQKDQSESFNKEVKEMTGKIGELSGSLSARDGEIKRLTDLLTNRNPEMESFFKSAHLYFVETKPTIEGNARWIEQANTTMTKLTELMKKMDEHFVAVHEKKK